MTLARIYASSTPSTSCKSPLNQRRLAGSCRGSDAFYVEDSTQDHLAASSECRIDSDFNFDLYAAAGNQSLVGNKLDLNEALPLEKALNHPLCSFRGTYADQLAMDTSRSLTRACTRFLHDLNWLEDRDRLSPSASNRKFAENHAHRLAKSLRRKGLLSSYSDTFEDYLSRGYIEPLHCRVYKYQRTKCISLHTSPLSRVGRITASPAGVPR